MPTPDPVFVDLIDAICARDPRYPVEAYKFVAQAVHHALTVVRRSEGTRHITAEEIVKSAASDAVSEYGPLASIVLRDWKLNANIDLANIVYNLIDAHVFAAGPNDSPEQFSSAPALHALIAEEN